MVFNGRVNLEHLLPDICGGVPHFIIIILVPGFSDLCYLGTYCTCIKYTVAYSSVHF